MRSVEGLKDFLLKPKNKKFLQKFLEKTHDAVGAAYADHDLSRVINGELRKFCAEITDVTAEDIKDVESIRNKYKREIESVVKDKRPFAVPLSKRWTILKKFLIGTVAAAIIAGTAMALKSRKTNNKKDKKETPD